MSFDVLKAGTFVESFEASSADPFRGGRSSRIEALERELDVVRRDADERLEREVARVREECERRTMEEWGNAARAMREAAIALKRAADAGLEAGEHDIVRIAVAVAERIVRREVSQDPAFVTELVRRLVARVVQPGSVRLRVHPSDHARISGERDAIQKESGIAQEILVIADRRVARGSCVLETPDFVIDGSRQGQLLAAEAALQGKGP
jgi:flagellar assembly protein FliH